MDLGGLNWALMTIVGAGLLAVVLLWAMLRNKSTHGAGMDRTEDATRRLYQEEEARREAGNDGVP
jgi:hypothetical protein